MSRPSPYDGTFLQRLSLLLQILRDLLQNGTFSLSSLAPSARPLSGFSRATHHISASDTRLAGVAVTKEVMDKQLPGAWPIVAAFMKKHYTFPSTRATIAAVQEVIMQVRAKHPL
jgi:hypothetical protein